MITINIDGWDFQNGHHDDWDSEVWELEWIRWRRWCRRRLGQWGSGVWRGSWGDNGCAGCRGAQHPADLDCIASAPTRACPVPLATHPFPASTPLPSKHRACCIAPRATKGLAEEKSSMRVGGQPLPHLQTWPVCMRACCVCCCTTAASMLHRVIRSKLFLLIVFGSAMHGLLLSLGGSGDMYCIGDLLTDAYEELDPLIWSNFHPWNSPSTSLCGEINFWIFMVRVLAYIHSIGY